MILLKQIFVMYVLMFVGFFLYRKKMVTDEGARDIGKILLNIVIPVIVISNFWIEKTPERTADLLHSMIISSLCMFISIVISYFIYHKRNRIDEFSTCFSNAGFIGIPLVQATLGSGAVFFISMMIVLVGVLQWTYGVYTITDERKYINLNKIVTNPIVNSVLIGLLIYVAGVPMPSVVNNVFTLISAMNTPLAMIVSGVYLAQSNILTVIRKKEVYVTSFVRLILIPVVTVFVFRFIRFGSQDLKLAILIAGACPVGANVAVFAQQYDKDYRRGIENVCVSTILSILTLPFIVYLASLILS